MVNIIILTHGEFGARLLECAENIVGVQKEGVRNISVRPQNSLESIKSELEQAVREMHSDDGLILLVDMPGGTPMNVAFPIVKDLPRCSVICGVNVNMLISAFTARKNLGFDKLSAKIVEDGRRAICEVKSLLGGTAV